MSIKNTFLKVGRTISKYSPEIYTTLGIAGYGATAYLSYKSRDKVEKVVLEVEESRANNEDVDKMQVARDLVTALYVPITVGTLSTGMILMAHRIQRKRILTLTGALAVQQAQNLYFERKYRKQHGDEAFEQFIVPTEQIKREEVDKNGKKKEVIEEVKKEIDVTIGEWYSESTEYASDDHGYNMAYIDSINEMLQTRLFQRGNLLLGEVREELGFDRGGRAGALLGWTTSDDFDIRKSITTLGDTSKGELKEQIYVSWTTPRYIYDDIEFNGRYSPY